MRTSLQELLALGRPALADGATGTNFFSMGLGSGDPPEFWNVSHPEHVIALHRSFVDAGADIILTNTFGCNRQRLALHGAQDRVFDIAKQAAFLARAAADSVTRPVVVAGSIGPTGSLFQPLGELTHDEAVASFSEQMRGLQAGGADVVWIETMSAVEELRAAAQAAIDVGMPYTATCSFDTAGRTMMGLPPADLASVFENLSVPPVAIGANCGVGAPDTLVSVLAMTEAAPQQVVISKGNCGVPRFQGTEIVYTGTPESMADYTRLAVAAGARIIGGCCGTSVQHLRQMRAAIDEQIADRRPTIDDIVERIGPLMNTPAQTLVERGGRERRRARS